MKTNLKALADGSGTCETTGPVLGTKPVLALLMRLLWAAALALPAFRAQAGVVFTSLYSFTGAIDGASPRAGLVQGSDGNFYGTTYEGGTNGGYGTVFKISANGVLTSLHSFAGATDGANPWWAALAQGSDGDFYGTTYAGGAYTNWLGQGAGTVFKISADGALTSLHSFGAKLYQGQSVDGTNPQAGLVQGSDGNFYGTTEFGGNFCGSVFKISANGALASLFWFSGGGSGGYPVAGLVQGSDGNFYGETSGGGSDVFGTVFEFSANGNAVTNPLSWRFSYGDDGASPEGGLVQGSDGSFYGTTFYSAVGPEGPYGYGTVFQIGTTGALTSLHSFSGAKDGAYPQAGLVQGRDGCFYGTTAGGGTSNSGTAFKISRDGVLTSLHSFAGSDGADPQAGLVQGSDGSFYGTTSSGGTGKSGTVFRLTLVPEPPSLTITPCGANVVLTWPTNALGFNLQSTTNLVSPAVWTTNSPGPVVVNGQNTVTNPMSGTQQFYRLSQ